MCGRGRRRQTKALSSSKSVALLKTSKVEGLDSLAFNFIAAVESADNVKSTPKRRRKQLKPGKTAKNNDRHFAIHHYIDHSQDIDNGDINSIGLDSSQAEGDHRHHGGVSLPFSVKLHEVLEKVEADGFAHIISWQIHGRCFLIHKPKEFVEYVMPRYFRQTKLTSFQRQLNLYGFNRITRGPDNGAYYSEYFLRWRVFLCKHMIRTKVKGTGFRAVSNPENEPDFYDMPFVTPMVSEASSYSDAPKVVSNSNSSISPLPLNSVSSSLDQLLTYNNLHPSKIATSDSLNQFLADLRKVDSVVSNPYAVKDDATDNNDWNDVNNQEDLDDDFSIKWDELFSSEFEKSLNDDVQLNYMLQKLMDD